uniref:Glycosyl hydrolase, BNR repeat n=1 Tax=Dechloromonas aromatica (strain RCB) TaxID=159087 RepID=Q47IL7_DECAR
MQPLSPAVIHHGSAGLFLAALAAAFLRLPATEAPAFVPPPVVASPLPADMTRSNLPSAGATAGPASLTLLADGKVAAAWLAGPGNDNSAATIWLSILGRSGWSQPLPAATRESTAAGTFAHMSSLGRPLLLAEGSWLHLWYESLPLGSGAGAAIVHSLSTDGGKTWSKAERLQTSPLGTLGNGLGGPPLMLADGGLGLPLDQRFPKQGSEWLRLSATGRIVDKRRLAHAAPTLQPAVVALDDHRGLAVLRDNRAGTSRATLSTTNGGQTWETASELALPAPDAPVALLRLASGRLLLAGNPQQGKEALQLWLSADDGQTWAMKRIVEAASDGGAEFADPALLQGRDGRIHLTYTWRQQQIRYVAFTEAWLAGGAP